MSSLLSNPAVSNLGASLVVMQVARKIDFEDQQVFTAVRAGYLFTQLLCLVAYYYCSYKVSLPRIQASSACREGEAISWARRRRRVSSAPRPLRAHDRTLTAFRTQIKSKNELKTIKYTEPKNPLVRTTSPAFTAGRRDADGPSAQSPDTSGGQVTTTIREYDLAQVSQGIRGVFMGMAFVRHSLRLLTHTR